MPGTPVRVVRTAAADFGIPPPGRPRRKERVMEVLYERCCGLDVHKKVVVGCLISPGAEGTTVKEIRSFGTMTPQVLALADWLAAAGVTHVAMESTGSY